MAKSNEPSSLSEIMEAASQGMSSPSVFAKLAGGIIAPHGAKEAAAQGLQGGWNAAVVGLKAFTEGVYRQYGPSAAARLNNQQIQLNIATRGQSNKGIEAFRQKSAENQAAPKSGQSTNKGIMSFQSKQSGQSESGTTKAASASNTIKAASTSGTTKGPSASGTIKAASASSTSKAASASAGKSSGSSSGGKSSGSSSGGSSGGKSSGGQGR